jgi:hypothetical protein
MPVGDWACPHCSRVLAGPTVARALALQLLYNHEKLSHPTEYTKHPLADVAAVRQSTQRGVGGMTICLDCGVVVLTQDVSSHRSERCPNRPRAPGPIVDDEVAPPEPESQRPKPGSAPMAANPALRGVEIRRVSFELLPPGSWDIEDVIAHYRQAAKNPGPALKGKVIQWDRLRELGRLHPKTCYVGKEGWDGYVVFEFANSPHAALECPIEGNATYIVSGDWKKKAGHSQLYLRTKCREFRARVFHRGDWVSRIEAALGRDR